MRVLTIVALLVGACSADKSNNNGAPPDFATPTGVDGGGPGPSIAGCPIFPADYTVPGGQDEWNRDVSAAALDPMSDAYIAAMNPTKKLHPDFGSDPSYGIPWITVPGTQPKVAMTFDYSDDSDPGPYPLPPTVPIEGGTASTGDRHAIVIDRDACVLYETYDTHFVGPGFHCGSGAIFNLRANTLRTDGFTSGDAAGLAILPGLVRRDEAISGEIRHAFRVTFAKTQKGYIHPATHLASSSTDATLPPMGLRLRMSPKKFDISGFTGNAKAIAIAMQKYGLIVADNGSDWYFTGEMNTAWDDNDLDQLKAIPGSAFEVVKTGTIMH
jgi:hypothetical protein